MRESQQGLAKLCRWLEDERELESFLEGSWQRYEQSLDTDDAPLIWWPVEQNLELCDEAKAAALAVLRDAIKREAKDARALGHLALAQYRSGHKDEAKMTLERLEQAVTDGSGKRAAGDRALLARVRETLQD